jgi:hypothetical protein
MGQTATGNALANANVPAGQTAQVTGFSIAGSTQVYPPGSNVTLTDPLTGQPIGTLVVSGSGAYTFDPVDGYMGSTPAINILSKTATGTAVSSLTIDVLPSECPHTCVYSNVRRADSTRCTMNMLHVHRAQHACLSQGGILQDRARLSTLLCGCCCCCCCCCS